MVEMAVLNIRHRVMPSTSPACTPMHRGRDTPSVGAIPGSLLSVCLRSSADTLWADVHWSSVSQRATSDALAPVRPSLARFRDARAE
jgi:hypothetical protein